MSDSHKTPCSCSKKSDTEQNQSTDIDIWDDVQDESYFMRDAQQADSEDHYGTNSVQSSEHVEISALKRTHAKQGYLDGLASAKERSLQQGFDQAYPDGAALALKVGSILAQLYHLANSPSTGEDATSLFERAKKELHITKVLSKGYFGNSLELTDNHKLITYWEEIVHKLSVEA